MIVQLTTDQLREIISNEVTRVLSDFAESIRPKQVPSQDEYATGIKGLMKAMDCGRGRANDISADPKYRSAKFGSGKSVYFNVSEIRRIDSHKNMLDTLTRKIK